MPKFPTMTKSEPQESKNIIDFKSNSYIIKQDNLNANQLKNTNTFEIGVGWLNIPIEIIHGTLYTQLKDSITYQQVISTDLDVLPLHRNNKDGEFSEWKNAQLPSTPINKKIDRLIKDNNTILEIVLNNTDTNIKLDAEFNKKLSELNSAFSHIQKMLSEASDLSLEHDLEIDTLKTNIYNDLTMTFDKQLDIYQDAFSKFILKLETKTDSKINDTIVEYDKTYDKLFNEFSVIINDSNSSFKSYAITLESSILKQLDNKIVDIGFDKTYVSEDTFTKMADKLEQSLLSKFKNLKVNSTRSVTEQMMSIRGIIRDEIQKNYDDVQDTFASIDERSEFKLKQLNDEIISLRNELRDTKNKNTSRNLSQFIINVEKRLKKLEQKIKG